jgi:hypothetical protein
LRERLRSAAAEDGWGSDAAAAAVGAKERAATAEAIAGRARLEVGAASSSSSPEPDAVGGLAAAGNALGAWSAAQFMPLDGVAAAAGRFSAVVAAGAVTGAAGASAAVASSKSEARRADASITAGRGAAKAEEVGPSSSLSVSLAYAPRPSFADMQVEREFTRTTEKSHRLNNQKIAIPLFCTQIVIILRC